MRAVLIGLAALALGACETMPEFLQPTTTTRESVSTPTSVAPPATAAASPRFTPPADQQLLELERQMQADAQARGLGAALAERIDPDYGIVIRPGQAYQGAEEITRGLAAPAGAGAMYWQPDRVHVSGDGSMGVTSGRYVQVVTGAEAVQGRYLMVWRRNADGVWKVLSESRTPDPARPAATRRR
jgi:ketosteroid isomerase-like protein